MYCCICTSSTNFAISSVVLDTIDTCACAVHVSILSQKSMQLHWLRSGKICYICESHTLSTTTRVFYTIFHHRHIIYHKLKPPQTWLQRLLFAFNVLRRKFVSHSYSLTHSYTVDKFARQINTHTHSQSRS